jgi:hypothetical protein
MFAEARVRWPVESPSPLSCASPFAMARPWGREETCRQPATVFDRFLSPRSGPRSLDGTTSVYGSPVSISDGVKQPIRKAVLWYSVRNRERKALQIIAWLQSCEVRDVLFVGTMGDEHAGDANMVNAGIVERQIAAAYEVKMSINVEPALTDYPFTIADARNMPFEDNYVDFALANAIIEHVGKEADQRKMVLEMTRVARSWVITTPNKWFPVESHTSVLFLHWFPSWRKKREDDFTRLLSRREFRKLLPVGARLEGKPWSPTFVAYFAR